MNHIYFIYENFSKKDKDKAQTKVYKLRRIKVGCAIGMLLFYVYKN